MKQTGPSHPTGFKVPDGYFERDFVDEVVNRCQSQEQQSAMPGFTVPDNYFQDLEVKLTRIAEQDKGRVVSMNSRNRLSLLVIAAAAALLLLINLPRLSSPQQSMDALDSTELLAYLAQEDVFYSEAATGVLSDIVAVEGVDTATSVDVEDMELYLLDETIINELYLE